MSAAPSATHVRSRAADGARPTAPQSPRAYGSAARTPSVRCERAKEPEARRAHEAQVDRRQRDVHERRPAPRPRMRSHPRSMWSSVDSCRTRERRGGPWCSRAGGKSFRKDHTMIGFLKRPIASIVSRRAKRRERRANLLDAQRRVRAGSSGARGPYKEGVYRGPDGIDGGQGGG